MTSIREIIKHLPFKGLKSYLIGAIMVAHGAFIIYYGQEATFANPTPDLDPDAGWRLIYEGLGISALRAGISKTVVGFGGRAASSGDTVESIGAPLTR